MADCGLLLVEEMAEPKRKLGRKQLLLHFKRPLEAGFPDVMPGILNGTRCMLPAFG